MSESLPKCPLCQSTALAKIDGSSAGVVPTSERSAAYECTACGAIFTVRPGEETKKSNLRVQ